MPQVSDQAPAGQPSRRQRENFAESLECCIRSYDSTLGASAAAEDRLDVVAIRIEDEGRIIFGRRWPDAPLSVPPALTAASWNGSTPALFLTAKTVCCLTECGWDRSSPPSASASARSAYFGGYVE
jgi:hypothetical protein